MRCSNCGYELWHCAGRTCSECGEGFSLYDFTFEQEFVRFHCPSCDEAYEGIPPRGRPDHNRHVCTQCDEPIDMEMYVVKPLPGYDTELDGHPLPFNVDDKPFLFSGIMSTIGIVLTSPSKAMGRISPQESISNAWALFCIVYLFTIVLSFLSSLLLLNFSLITGDAPNTDFLFYLIQYAAYLFATFLFIFLWTGAATFVIHCTGGSQYSIGRTLQVILYSGCAMVFTIIPCAGGLIAFAWWIAAASIMLKRAHRITTGRAVSAGLSGVLALLIPCCLIWGAMMYPAIGVARNAANQAQIKAQQQMQNPPIVVKETIDRSLTQPLPAETTDSQSE